MRPHDDQLIWEDLKQSKSPLTDKTKKPEGKGWWWCGKEQKWKRDDQSTLPQGERGHGLRENIDFEEMDQLKAELLKALISSGGAQLVIQDVPNSNKISINGIQVTIDSRDQLRGHNPKVGGKFIQ